MASAADSTLSSPSLPDDIALNIASILSAKELCSLGSCSCYFRDLCASDFLWIGLFKRRWPSLSLTGVLNSSSSSSETGWRGVYIKQHKKLAEKVSTINHFVKDCSQNESIEISDYLKAVAFLGSAELGFEDVKLFLFTENTNVLMNLIGVHYSIFCLQIPIDVVNAALYSCQVSTREVCVFSFRLGRWFFGFRMPDEHSSRRLSLAELTTSNEEQLRTFLNRGLLHDVLRVHIISPSRFNVASSAALPDPRVPN